MRVLLFLLLLVVISGTQACLPDPEEPIQPQLDPVCKCGLVGPTNRRPKRIKLDNSTSKGTRIVGGVDAGRHEFPWIARVEGKNHFCGGSILSSRTILTAAHCINKDSVAANYKVYIMDYERFFSEDREIEHAVQKVEYHDKFDEDSFDYDYGIITLKQAVDFNSNVYPICLPDDNRHDRVDTLLVAAGWGRTDPNSAKSHPDKLQKVTLKVVDNDECRCEGFFCWIGSVFGGNTDRQLCLKRTDTSKKQCTGKGDSGGPAMKKILAWQQQQQQYVSYYSQIGIVSAGSVSGGLMDCKYDIEAKVSRQLDWIKDRITGIQCKKPKDDHDLATAAPIFNPGK